MSDLDLTAVPFEEQAVPAQIATTSLEDVATLVKGLVTTLALAFGGMFLVVVALMVGVVGAPLVVAAIAYAVIRQRRVARGRAWTPA
jgi:hypothetical protein